MARRGPPRQVPARPPAPTRDTYDQHWLNTNDVSLDSRHFKEHRAGEHEYSRPLIEPFLAQAIRDHHISRGRIAACLRGLNHSETAAFFADEFPKEPNTQKGNFGEVVASEHLVQRYGFVMPVLKLRYRDSNMPMRGEDIVAFELAPNRAIIRVIIGEAKAGRTFRANVVQEAHDRLRSAFNPRPMTLSLLSNILYERGESELGAEIDRVSRELLRGAFPRMNWIFLINEEQPDDPFQSLADHSDLITDLSCVRVQLDNLDLLITNLFRNAVETIHEGR